MNHFPLHIRTQSLRGRLPRTLHCAKSNWSRK